MSAHPPLRLLLFSLGATLFGLDAEQVAELHPYAGEEEGLLWFHRQLCCHEVNYVSPTVAVLRTAPPCRLVIDAMEEIAACSRDEIRLFPPLVEPFALRKGMWGILPRDGAMVLLVDLQLLLESGA